MGPLTHNGDGNHELSYSRNAVESAETRTTNLPNIKKLCATISIQRN